MTVPGVDSFDTRVMSWVAAHRTGHANHVAKSVMFYGTTPRYLVVGCVLVLVAVVWLRAYRPAIAAVAALAVAVVMAQLLKQAFDRPRPPTSLAIVLTRPPSFPSTHAAVTSALAVAVLVAFSWSSPRAAYGATAVALSLVVFVGICLVYLGAHWPTDVLAGWVLGGLIGGCCGLLARRRRVPT